MKLEENKLRSANKLKRKQEIETETLFINSNINAMKAKLRELNAFYPY